MALWSHVQTVTSALPLRRAAPPHVVTEVHDLPLPDDAGHMVVVARWQPRRAPAVVVCHGVSGSSDDAYVVRATIELLREGFHVVAINGRGSGRGIGRSRRLYHGGLGEDVALAVRFAAARDDVTSVGALGFSLGGHLALTHAADVSDAGLAGAPGQLAAVATVSAPVDLSEPADAFRRGRRGMTGVYERLIVRSLLEKARALKAREGERAPFHLDELRAIETIQDFDSLVTVRCNGFVDVNDYYTRMSVGPRLAGLRVPALLIHAEDDPIVPANAVRRVERSAHVDVDVRPAGGHVGFVEELEHLWGSTSAVARATAHLRRHLKAT